MNCLSDGRLVVPTGVSLIMFSILIFSLKMTSNSLLMYSLSISQQL